MAAVFNQLTPRWTGTRPDVDVDALPSSISFSLQISDDVDIADDAHFRATAFVRLVCDTDRRG